jgi:O-antigen/teichoic acid export membrane protein
LLRSAAVAAAFTIVAGASVGLLVGAGRFSASAAAYGVGFLLFAIAIVPLSAAVGPAGALFALAVLFAGTGAVAIARTGASLHDPSRSPHTAGRIRAVWNFFVPMLVAAGLVTPVMWLVNALLARSAAPLDELSRFNAAYSWFAVLSFVPGVLAQVEFVAIAQARARGDTREMSRKLRRFVVQNALVMLPLALAIAALAPFLVGLYRLEGPLAERTLVLMAAAAFVASLGNPAGLFLSATDRTWIASALNLAWGLATISLCWLFREQGATGAALAFLVGYAVHCAIAILVAHVLLAREPRRPL